MEITLDKNVAANGPNPYTSRGGKTMFRYIVLGTPEELKAYKESKEKEGFYRESKEKQPFLFAGSLYSNGTKLELSSKGNYFVNDSEQKIYAQACKEGGAEFAAQKVAEYRNALHN